LANLRLNESILSALSPACYPITSRRGPVQTSISPSLTITKYATYISKAGSSGTCLSSLTSNCSVQDSPNSAGMVIDVVRATKLALDRGVNGSLTSISSYAFKHPPVQVPDHMARQWVEEFIQGKRER